MKLLLSGASGFIGSVLLRRLKSRSYDLIALGRRAPRQSASGQVRWLECDLASSTSPLQDIERVDAVVHLAARAHVLAEIERDALSEFRRVNVEGTLNLARQAAKRGAKRFVFISTVGVLGNKSTRPFTERDPPDPAEPYAVSKLEAEIGLRRLADETGMELVICRPPLVYGPLAPGNFARLFRLIDRGVPLPLGAVRNRRSLVAVDNLVDLILTCLDHPAAASKTFLVSDGHDLSTPELISRLAEAMGRPARLFPVPPGLLRLAGRLTGHSVEVKRLIDSLQVDIGYTCGTLNWRPPVPAAEALRRTAPAPFGQGNLL
ncbi:MAG: SDR family oxidoreductase [Desulfohalobiaceae bacterium]|nr:SDR family oxidoreductase [Desulfohalobiaceae bacterium]